MEKLILQPKPWKKLAHSIKTQWITSIALIPITLLLFQQASLVGFFANFVAILDWFYHRAADFIQWTVHAHHSQYRELSFKNS